jgi:hypothetical protein
MASPDIELRVGIDAWHTTRVAEDGTETLYMAARALPDESSEDVLIIDSEFLNEMRIKNVDPQEAVRVLRDVGDRCRSVNVYREMPQPSVEFRTALARAAGALVATLTPYTSPNGLRGAVRTHTIEGFVLDPNTNWSPAYTDSAGVERSRAGSEIYLPVNGDALPRTVRDGFFRPRH